MTATLVGLVAGVTCAAAIVGASPRPARRRPLPTPRGGRRAAPPWWVAEACRQLGLQTHPAVAWRAALGTTSLAATAALLAVGPAAAATVVALAGVTPRLLAPHLSRRRAEQRDRQLPEALEAIAGALRAGAAPRGALLEVVPTLRPPLGDEVRAVASAIERGAPLGEALQRWAGSPGASRSVVLAASALELGSAAGGEVARAVDGVASTLRERQELQDEAASLATQARTSAWLLAAAPAAFAAVVATVEPAAVRFLLTTAPGLACLGAGVALDLLGLAWMSRIVRRAA